MRGGSPFLKDDNTKYYKYDLVLDNELVKSGEAIADGDIKLQDLEKAILSNLVTKMTVL